MTDDDIFSEILAREGGWVDRADDAGGPTNHGITLATLREDRPTATVADLRALTENDAREIYRRRYLRAPGFGNAADPTLRALLVDSAVNSGPKNAVRFLQRALHRLGHGDVVDDGEFGAHTLRALLAESQNARRVFLYVYAEREEFIGAAITDNLTDRDRDGIPDNTENAKGWSHRLGALLREAA